MRETEDYYNKWIDDISDRTSSEEIQEHIIHHANQLNDPETNAPLSWVASMYNLLGIYEKVHSVKSTVPVQLFKLIKKYQKDPNKYTSPPGGNISLKVEYQEVEASSVLNKV